MDGAVDISVLSFTLEALPGLKKVELTFCGTVNDENWTRLSHLPSSITVKEESYEHYLRVASESIKSAINKGVAIHNISLSGLGFPCFDPGDYPDLGALWESLRSLLEPVQVLPLAKAEFPLHLLSQHAPDLRRLDLTFHYPSTAQPYTLITLS